MFHETYEANVGRRCSFKSAGKGLSALNTVIKSQVNTHWFGERREVCQFVCRFLSLSVF